MRSWKHLLLPFLAVVLHCSAQEFDPLEYHAEQKQAEAAIARLFEDYLELLDEGRPAELSRLFDQDLLLHLESFDFPPKVFIPPRRILKIEVLAQRRLGVTPEQFERRVGMTECIVRMDLTGMAPEYRVCYVIRRGARVGLRTIPTGPDIASDLFDFSIRPDDPSRLGGILISSETESQRSELGDQKTEAQPGATDNPDDAQRLREDH